VSANAATNQLWLPAGPASNLITTPVFTDQVAEFNNIQRGVPPGSGSSIDFTDQPLNPNSIFSADTSAQFLVTPEILEHGYFELQFDLSNNFWSCDFNFGNSPCGIHIRQGIDHLMDRTAFVNNDPNVTGRAAAIDNPVSLANDGLTTPSSCTWDLLYAETTQCL